MICYIGAFLMLIISIMKGFSGEYVLAGIDLILVWQMLIAAKIDVVLEEVREWIQHN